MRIIVSMLVACLLCLGAGAAAARDVIPVPAESDALELAPLAERLQSAEKVMRVDTAPDGSGETAEMRVEASGPGPIYRWLVFSLRNMGRSRLEYVLAHPRRGIAGSGLFWPRLTSLRIAGMKASGVGAQPARIKDPGHQAFGFSVGPGQTLTYAVQVEGDWPRNLTLWSKDRFEEYGRRWAFVKGLLLGIALLAAIYVSTLIFIRRKLIFPAAAVLAWAAVALLCLDFGYLPDSAALTLNPAGNVRALVEGLVLIGLLVFLLVFLELRRSLPVIAFAMLFLLLLAALVTALAAFSPQVSSGLSRLMILFTVAGGTVLVGYLAVRGLERARSLVPTWSFVVLWVAGAAASVTELVPHAMFSLALDSGLVLIALLLAGTVTQFAFASSLLSSGLDLENDRKALALAGAEQCVWDLDTERQRFYVGPELERLLGLKGGTLKSADKDAWLELMHPDDRNNYLSAVKSVIERGNGTFIQEFRLRRVDGGYRWFRLRARAFSGENGKAHRCIGALADITADKRAQSRLLRDAVNDAVTGLPNRALFMDRLDQAMARARSDGGPAFALLVIDIDRFKRVNDGLGHTVGDSLLMTVARRLQKLLKPSDTLARISGDQFGVIVSLTLNTKIGEVQNLAERMRIAIAKPVKLKPREIQITASIGVAEYDKEVKSGQELFKNAEVALHVSKRMGKDKVELYDPKMRARSISRYHLEADLRHAIERGEIEVIYQPIARVGDLCIAGFEALIRWAHPKLGMLAPKEFIDIAEESGAIIEIGRYVLNEATFQLAQWQRLASWTEPLFVSVNVSSRQVLSQELVDQVRLVLQQNKVEPGTLKLEITESLVMSNPEISSAVLEELRDLGAGLSLDDFGTGYSSLSYLPRFPFDTVKIDASFVQNAKFDHTTAVILSAIARLAHDLEMTVVAEGVEAEQDLGLLREYGCQFAQGFYLGQPMPAKSVARYLGGDTSNWPHLEMLGALKEAARDLHLPEAAPQPGQAPPAQALEAETAAGEEPAPASLADGAAVALRASGPMSPPAETETRRERPAAEEEPKPELPAPPERPAPAEKARPEPPRQTLADLLARLTAESAQRKAAMERAAAPAQHGDGQAAAGNGPDTDAAAGAKKRSGRKAGPDTEEAGLREPAGRDRTGDGMAETKRPESARNAVFAPFKPKFESVKPAFQSRRSPSSR